MQETLPVSAVELSVSSLPLPQSRRLSSPLKAGQLNTMVPLQEQSAANRNIKTNMPAPLKKVLKPESRKTLVERAGAVSRPTHNSTSLVRSKSTNSLSHVRTNSITATGQRLSTTRNATQSIPGRTGATSRPGSVNSVRPSSAASIRPASATSTRAENENTVVKKVRRAAWDTKGRLEDMEEAYRELKDQFKVVKTSAVEEKDTISTELQDEKTRVAELLLQKQTMQCQFDAANEQIGKLTGEIHIARMEREQLIHRHKMDIEEERAVAFRAEQQIRMEVSDRERELEMCKRDADNAQRQLEAQIDLKNNDIRAAVNKIEHLEDELARERRSVSSLKDQIAEQSTGTMTLQQFAKSLQLKIDQMENDALILKRTIETRTAELHASDSEKRELMSSLINEETQRRILHNQIQELKGNIRVFCRVRPTLPHEPTDATSIQLTDRPDDIEVIGTGAEMSLSGKEDKTYGFHFDKVSLLEGK